MIRKTRRPGRAVRIAAASVLVLAAGAAAAADVYRWQDDDGTVNYGTSPPPGVEAERVGVDPGEPTGESPDLGDGSAPGDEAADADEDADDEPALSSEECADLEERLVMIEANPAGILIEDDEGNVTRMAQEDRDAEMEQIREALDEHCN